MKKVIAIDLMPIDIKHISTAEGIMNKISKGAPRYY